MRDIIKVVYEGKLIHNYKINVLSGNECELFLPVTFTFVEDQTIGLFSAKGYAPLLDCGLLSTTDALCIFTDVISKIKDAMCRFIFPEDYKLCDSSLYFDSSSKSIKSIYLPNEKFSSDILSFEGKQGIALLENQYLRATDSIYPNLKTVAELLCEISNDSTCKYIRQALDFIKQSNYGIDYALQRIETLKSESYKLGVDRMLPFREV